MLLLLLFLLPLYEKKLIIITYLFKKLIYETRNNIHKLAIHMSTLIMWHNRFSEKESEGVRYTCHDIKIPGPKSHDIEIPRLKSHEIEFRRNSDPYAPWYGRHLVRVKENGLLILPVKFTQNRQNQQRHF